MHCTLFKVLNFFKFCFGSKYAKYSQSIVSCSTEDTSQRDFYTMTLAFWHLQETWIFFHGYLSISVNLHFFNGLKITWVSDFLIGYLSILFHLMFSLFFCHNAWTFCTWIYVWIHAWIFAWIFPGIFLGIGRIQIAWICAWILAWSLMSTFLPATIT